jgi:hypothetical protein
MLASHISNNRVGVQTAVTDASRISPRPERLKVMSGFHRAVITQFKITGKTSETQVFLRVCAAFVDKFLVNTPLFRKTVHNSSL